MVGPLLIAPYPQKSTSESIFALPGDRLLACVVKETNRGKDQSNVIILRIRRLNSKTWEDVIELLCDECLGICPLIDHRLSTNSFVFAIPYDVYGFNSLFILQLIPDGDKLVINKTFIKLADNTYALSGIVRAFASTKTNVDSGAADFYYCNGRKRDQDENNTAAVGLVIDGSGKLHAVIQSIEEYSIENTTCALDLGDGYGLIYDLGVGYPARPIVSPSICLRVSLFDSSVGTPSVSIITDPSERPACSTIARLPSSEKEPFRIISAYRGLGKVGCFNPYHVTSEPDNRTGTDYAGRNIPFVTPIISGNSNPRRLQIEFMSWCPTEANWVSVMILRGLNFRYCL